MWLKLIGVLPKRTNQKVQMKRHVLAEKLKDDTEKVRKHSFSIPTVKLR